MIYSLDTSTAVDLLRGEEAAVRERFNAARARGDGLKLSAVALYELAFGAYNSGRTEAHLNDLDRFLAFVDVIPFEGDDAMTAGRVRAELERLPFPNAELGAPDLLIGSQALGRDWVVATSNIRHFARIPRLRMVDWRRSDDPLSAQDTITRLKGGSED